jgi:hypothetical protein
MTKKIDQQEFYRSEKEEVIRNVFAKLFRQCPIPDDGILQNLGLFLSSKNLSRILFMDHIYRQIVDVHGVVFEFGTRWGPNLATFSALRGIYEPFNRIRKIVGFDTFEGFPGITDKDNKDCSAMREGGLACTENYAEYLEKIMEYHEEDNPVSHIKKFEIRVGDATCEIEKYLKEFPETIVSLAYFDFDIYEPTKKCLEAIKDRVVKGSVLAFDELCDHDSPGETLALQDVFGLRNIRLKRFPYNSRTSYFIVE